MQIMDEVRRTKLINLTFDKYYSCIVAPLYLDAVAELPFMPEGESLPFYDTSARAIHTVENTNNKAIMETLFGNVRYTGNEKEDNSRAKTPVPKRITIAQMAEVLSIGGTFQFTVPSEATDIIDVIDEYITGLHRNSLFEIMYHQPPKEDVIKLKSLSSTLLPLVNRLVSCGEVTGDWADIDALFSNTGGFTVGGNNNDFLTVPKLNSGVSKKNKPSVPGPYEF